MGQSNVDLYSGASYYAEGVHDFASEVAGVGDVNGDGLDDLLIGTYQNDGAGQDAGQVYLVFGAAAGWAHGASLAEADASFLGEAPGDFAGVRVSGAGDVDSDGFQDLIVSASRNDEGGTNAGQAYLIMGKPSGWMLETDLGESDASFHAEAAGDELFDVAGIGDVNGDGFDDLLVGCPLNSETGSASGQSYLVLGKPAGWLTDASLGSADASFLGEDVNDGSGGRIASAGDVNGDGLDDFLIGSMYNNEGGMYAGQVYLILGRAVGWSMDTPLLQADASHIGEAPEDTAGWSLDGVGDVNGDGLDDFIIGAEANDDGGNCAGKVYLIFGRVQGWSMDTPLSAANASYLGEDEVDFAGWASSGMGDINGDGYDDAVTSAKAADTTYVILGRPSGWALNTSLAHAGAVFHGYGGDSGWDASGVGDINGDGYDDFAVAAPYAGIGGGVDIIFGYPCWDADGDGVDSCSGDCDDLDADTYPGAPELCDGRDNDCDGVIPADEVDADGDGQMICEGDCDDDEPAVHAGEHELCDGLDNDCDPTTDELVDADGDGYSVCDGDCNDESAEMYPGAVEDCDWIDNDCDGLLPEDEQDMDGDGFAPCDGDCDDSDGDVNPLAEEEPYNDVDEDCDGVELWDVDGDGHDGGWPPDDCDDENASVYPGAHEFCDDGVDNDCDELVDLDDPDCQSDDDDSADDDDGDDDTTDELPDDDCACRNEISPRARVRPGVALLLAILVLAVTRRA